VGGLAGVSARRGGGCPAIGERWDPLRHCLPAADRRGGFLSPGVDAAEVAVLKAGDAQRVSPPRLGCSTLARDHDAVDAAMNLADQHLRGQVRRNGDCQAEHGCQVALIAAKQPSGSPAGPTASTGSDTSRTPSTTR
jgi:hypothetical protein